MKIVHITSYSLNYHQAPFTVWPYLPRTTPLCLSELRSLPPVAGCTGCGRSAFTVGLLSELSPLEKHFAQGHTPFLRQPESNHRSAQECKCPPLVSTKKDWRPHWLQRARLITSHHSPTSASTFPLVLAPRVLLINSLNTKFPACESPSESASQRTWVLDIDPILSDRKLATYIKNLKIFIFLRSNRAERAQILKHRVTPSSAV